MTSSRPRILYICSSWPHDQTHGGQLRALYVGRALKQVGDVTVVVVSQRADNEAARKKTAEEFDVACAIQPQLAPNRGALQKLRWALDPRFLNVHGTVASEEDRERVLRLAQDHDLVWVMNARTPSILQIWRWPHAHLDVDDLPSTYLKMVGRSARERLSRWKANVQCRLLHRREHRFHERFTTLSVCSDADRAYLGTKGVHVIPNGFARPAVEPRRTPQTNPPRLGFIGLYSYPPNLDGMRWFLQEVWPLVRRVVPDARLRLVGKDTDGPLKPTHEGVDPLGWVADPTEEIATWSATVIPIRIGGGTRIKLADAFSRKCPVVSTTFGAHGYSVEHGRQLLLADTAGEFAAGCIELLRDQARARALADSAWSDFLASWTWEAIAPRIWTAAESCLCRSSHSFTT